MFVRLMILTLMSTTASFSAHAAMTSSADVALFSDYRFRGVSQTERKPAIQGGFTLNEDNGFSIGFWGSNVNFYASPQEHTSLEFDFSLSYGREFSEANSWAITFVQYSYPGYSSFNYPEFILDLGIGNFSVQLVHSNDYLATKKSALVGALGYTYPARDWLGVNFFYGSVQTDARLFGSADPASNMFTDNYAYYGITAVAQWKEDGINWQLGWEATDVSDKHCAGNTCESTLVLGVSKSF